MNTESEVISRLKFLSKIQKGEKINVKYMYVQPEGIFTTISRTIIHQDNRRNTLNFIRQTLSGVFTILKKQQSTYKYERLTADLTQVKSGLDNLKSTYISDIKFCCDIDTMLEEINNKLLDINIKTAIYKEEHESSSSDDGK